jgi:hypothetical protein
VIVSMMTDRTKRQKRTQWGLCGSEISLVKDKEMLCTEHNATVCHRVMEKNLRNMGILHIQ